jgi:PAS domain S-box-containing protein
MRSEKKRAEKELLQDEARLQSILDGSPILQFVIDNNHRVISWNRALGEYSGIKASEIIGTDHQWRAFYPERRPVLADLLVDGNTDGLYKWYAGKLRKSRYVEGAYEALDFFPRMGISGKWLSFTAAAIRDPQGTIVGAVETLEDVTERVLAENAVKESEAKYRTLFENARDAMLVLENDRIIDCNASLLSLLGMESKDLIYNKTVPMISPPLQPDGRDSAAKAKEMMDIAFGNGSHRFDWVCRRMDGETFWAEVSLTAIPISGRPTLHAALRDITDRKRAEKQADPAKPQVRPHD